MALTPVLVQVNVIPRAEGAFISLVVSGPSDAAAAAAAARDVLKRKGLLCAESKPIARTAALWGLSGLEGRTLAGELAKVGVQPVFELFVDGKRAKGSLTENAAALFGSDEWVGMGELELGGYARVSDPCYGGDGVELLLAKGLWRAQRHNKTITWFGVGDRNWALRAWHPSFDVSRFETDEGFEHAGVAGVDSGQLGLIASRRVQDARESPDYDAIFEYTSGRRDAPYRDFGWFVSSGVGDGGYDVFAARNERSEVVAVRVVFITEDDGS